jgi:collagenase-like PrtC family protease
MKEVPIELSVPYNDDPTVLKEYFANKTHGTNRIREVYLAGPQEYSGSGRLTDELSLEQFSEIVASIHAEGLRVNLVFNSTCEGSSWYKQEIIKNKLDYLQEVHENLGVEAVTIANPFYIKATRDRLPNIEICASVLGDIDNVQRAMVFTKAGANVLTTDVNINRSLDLLREIKKTTGAEIKLMVNEGCLYKCPFRKFHFNYISHKSMERNEEVEQCFFFNCLPVIMGDNTQLLKSGWIRPEDMRKYSEISTFFKIVGRSCASAMLIRAATAYLKESWEGDLLDLISGPLNLFSVGYGAYLDNKELDKKKFFEVVTKCHTHCSDCTYCQDIIEQNLKFKVLTREKVNDLGMAGLQEVTRMVAEIEKSSPSLKTK